MPGSGSSDASADPVGVAGAGATTPAWGGEGMGDGGGGGMGDGVRSTGDSLQLNERARATTRKHNVNNRGSMKRMLTYLLVE